MKKKKWTVMVYLAGDNNLTEECLFALKELKRVGTRRTDGRRDADDGEQEGESANAIFRRRTQKPRDVNVIAQLDPSGLGNQTRRFHVGDANEDGLIDLDVVDVLKDETDTGGHAYLLDFLIFCITNFPADHYMVVLAGHGNGTDQDFFLRDEGRPFSLVPSSLSIPDLQEVFKKDGELHKALGGKRIDILGFDTCLMSMAEVCYQLRNSTVKLMIGSEGFSPTAGWPHHRVLNVLNKEPDIKPEQLARKIVRRYTRFYRNYELGGLSVDQSVLRVDKIENLKVKVKLLTDVLSRKLKEEHNKRREDRVQDRGKGYGFPRPRFIDAIIMAHWEAQSYNGEQFIDLFDFCCILMERYDLRDGDDDKEREWVQEVGAACEEVMYAITGRSNDRESKDRKDGNSDDAVVLMSCYNGPTYQYSYGVSVYFPWACGEFANHYFHDDDTVEMAKGSVEPHTHLSFPIDSGWGKFLQIYFKATVLRPPRKEKMQFVDSMRSGPPASKGPNARVHSMRNPPLYYYASVCESEPEE